jgi:pinin
MEFHQLEEELKSLFRQRSQAEYRLKILEKRERAHVVRSLQGKHSRDSHNQEVETENEHNEDTTTNSNKKRLRLSSAVVALKPATTKIASDEREKEGKAKVSSAIVTSEAITSSFNKPRPSLKSESKEVKQRDKKIFGILVGTLQKFKEDSVKKSEIITHREEIVQKIETKVSQQREEELEKLRNSLKEEKAKELSQLESIKKKQEEKEQEMLNLRWKQHEKLLSNFLKTEAKPPIFYRIVDKSKPTENNTEVSLSTNGNEENTHSNSAESIHSHDEARSNSNNNDRMEIEAKTNQTKNAEEPSENLRNQETSTKTA